VGNTADRSQPVIKTSPYAFVLAPLSKLPLAQAELIIEVQKKVSLLLGIPLAAVGSDGSNS
jgi:hypothetical protein